MPRYLVQARKQLNWTSDVEAEADDIGAAQDLVEARLAAEGWDAVVGDDADFEEIVGITDWCVPAEVDDDGEAAVEGPG